MEELRKPTANGSYEKDEDLVIEISVAGMLCSKMPGWKHSKMSKFDPVDFRLIEDDKTCAFLEVRSRNNPHDKYNPVFVSEIKWNNLLNLGVSFNVPVIFAFCFTDGVYCFDVMKYGPYDTTFAKGRGNCATARKSDYEKCVGVDVERMNFLGTR